MRFHQHGGPQVLRWDDVPTPSPGPGEVRIQVKALGLNHLDIFVREGMPGVETPLPHITGGDVAGTVDAVGEDVEGLAAGDAVLVNPALNCGECEYCIAGDTPLCLHSRTLGEEVDGGMAEYIVVPACHCLHMPLGLAFEEAACLPIAYGTAWRMLITRGGLRPMETVLIMGSGGVSVAALQIARLCGARVIMAVGSEEKAKRAEALGAELAFSYRDKDVVRTVRQHTHKRGADMVVDSVGTATWQASQLALGKGGRLVCCGATTGYELTTDARYLFVREQSLIGSNGWTDRELRDMLAAVGSGRVKPVIDRTYPVTEAAVAEEYLEHSGAFGKVVLTF